jgi:LDH2 family malate/lactate/ureidoglycolate dehydrogenase
MASRDALERYQKQLPCVNRFHRPGCSRSKSPTFSTRSNGVSLLIFAIGLRWRRNQLARHICMTGKTETIDVATLEALCVAALVAAGARAQDAAACAHILVDAELMGISTHGVVRVPDYARRLRAGGIDAGAVPRLERRAPSLALVDGANALGPVVGTRALEAAIELARASGIAHVGCRASNHFGAIAPYARMACEAGYVMLAGTNASSTMSPWGGRELRLGNNPLCIAAPGAGGAHFILDIAMSVAARGKIRAALKEGRPIPEGWAADKDGRPATDPAAALAGFLLPFGAHKGSGLSMAVDLLSGVLSGARFLTDVVSWVDNATEPQGTGHFILLIDPARLIGSDAYAAAMGRFRQLIKDTPAADPTQPVLLPGERELARRAQALKGGIALPAALLGELREWNAV